MYLAKKETCVGLFGGREEARIASPLGTPDLAIPFCEHLSVVGAKRLE
jgi:hypothetical protein